MTKEEINTYLNSGVVDNSRLTSKDLDILKRTEKLKKDILMLEKYNNSISEQVNYVGIESIVGQTLFGLYEELVKRVIDSYNLHESFADDFEWFIYETNFGKRDHINSLVSDITIDDREYFIHSLNDFLYYTIKEWRK